MIPLLCQLSYSAQSLRSGKSRKLRRDSLQIITGSMNNGFEPGNQAQMPRCSPGSGQDGRATMEAGRLELRPILRKRVEWSSRRLVISSGLGRKYDRLLYATSVREPTSSVFEGVAAKCRLSRPTSCRSSPSGRPPTRAWCPDGAVCGLRVSAAEGHGLLLLRPPLGMAG